jgi:hypothetical protein
MGKGRENMGMGEHVEAEGVREYGGWGEEHWDGEHTERGGGGVGVRNMGRVCMMGIARGKGHREHKEGSMEGDGEASLSLCNINIPYSPSPCSQPSCNATLPMASFPSSPPHVSFNMTLTNKNNVNCMIF